MDLGLAKQDPIDWQRVQFTASEKGTLYEYLLNLPVHRWKEVDPHDGSTFLHYATHWHAYPGDDYNLKAAKLLIKHGVDINAQKYDGDTPAHLCIWRAQKQILECLCAANANMHLCGHGGFSVIDISRSRLDRSNARILISNGYVRSFKNSTIHEIVVCVFLKARSAVVALLKLYKSYRTRLNRIGCKYMMQELVVAVWATRTNEDWHKM